jgi:hypothetical protein
MSRFGIFTAPGCLRHRIGREPAPTALSQNVSRGLQDSVDGRLGTRLLRLLGHHGAPIR